MIIPLLNDFLSHLEMLSCPFLVSSGETIVSLVVAVERDLPKLQRAGYHQIVLSFVVLRVSC